MTTKAIILAAGKGTRMQSDKSKVLHEICGKPMLSILLETAKKINTDEICVVIGPDSDDIKNLLGNIPYVCNMIDWAQRMRCWQVRNIFSHLPVAF